MPRQEGKAMVFPPLLKGFIVLEGLDGAGTTTQKELLFRRFRDEGLPCYQTSEPTDLPSGRLIRSILKGEVQAQPGTLARLFSADRNEHLFHPKEGILSHLSRGETVICDRYAFSSLAYQSLSCGFDFVLSINRDFPLPDYLFFIDVPTSVSEERLKDRSHREIFEYEEVQKRVLAHYRKVLELYRDSGMTITALDGCEDRDVISEKIFRVIGKKNFHKDAESRY